MRGGRRWRRSATSLTIALVSLIAGELGAVGCQAEEAETRIVLRTEPLGGLLARSFPDGSEVPATVLWDRLIVEVRAEGSAVACAGCRRAFSPTELLARGESTFSLVTEGRGSILQISLDRGRVATPRVGSTIALTGTFTPFTDGERHDLVVNLPYESAGRTQGTWESPLTFSAPAALDAPPSAAVACETETLPGQGCVPGGIFWFGDPSLDLIGGVNREGTDERLVKLSPFWLDETEVTVAALRAAEVADGIVPIRHSRQPGCTYSDQPAARDDLPVNCVTWPLANAYCRAVGKRLPTEAELEYVQGGLRSRRYVWGDGPAECGDTNVGGDDCQATGVAAPGSFPRDRLRLFDHTFVDLMGNLAEWTADRWNSVAKPEACFVAGVLVDPRCDLESERKPGFRVVKGQGFDLELLFTGAGFRLGLDGTGAYNESVGFRCARDGIRR
jgi:formylglycine-generating enzyme required for sulfatase activity